MNGGYCMSIILNSFHPLCFYRNQVAVSQYNQLPFVDHSNRREPSLENDYPLITSLCRVKKLVPRLNVGDKVVYITIQDKKRDSWYLVAILEVIKVLHSHRDAYLWYSSRGLETPNNCIFQTEPLPIHLTAMNGDEIWYKESLRAYTERVQIVPKVVISRSNYIELTNPVSISRIKMVNIFGKIPSTENPPYITEEQFEKLLALVQ